MIYKPSAGMPLNVRQEIQQRLKFQEDGVIVEGLAGVLDLIPELSATTEHERAPDPGLHPLALPVPVMIKNDAGLFRVLPGAPYAFANAVADNHVDFGRLRIWCDQHGDFSQTVKNRLSEY